MNANDTTGNCTNPTWLSGVCEPPLPNFVSEWFALIPLIIHLATPKGDHNLVGELALAGRLTLSLVPKVGHLYGISSLLSGIPDFLDRTSSKTDLSSNIWDVGWGSSFPCANGAARDFLTRHALMKKEAIDAIQEDKPDGFRRYQRLHIVKVDKVARPEMSWLKKSWKFLVHIAHIPCLLAFAVLTILLKAYGSAATVIVCIITQIACRFVPIGRPAGYLTNTERPFEFACMLSGIHQNASTWYLYIGDRATIDWLLNKTMITIKAEDASLWAQGFYLAHIFQLLAMTFVAANKGWDGVCLLALLVTNMAFKFILEYPTHWAALRWISESGLRVEAHSFRLTGRVPMLGAIQLLSANQRHENNGQMDGDVAWMDDILSPFDRRKVWAKKLANIEKSMPGEEVPVTDDGESKLSDPDREWVEQNLKWTKEAHECISKEMGKRHV